MDGQEASRRREELDRLRGDPAARPYVDLLEALLNETPNAVDVVDRWVQAGRVEKEAIDLLASLVDEGELDGWTDWEEIADRSEVQLRLQVLAEAGSLDESFARFLTFFFRASDPQLYRLAAIALGRHIDSLPEAKAYLDRYAEARGISLGDPADLDGYRSARRLLFLQVGAATRNEAAESVPLGDPVDAIDAIAGTPAGELDAVDLSAALRAAERLVAHEKLAADRTQPLLELAPRLTRPNIDRELLDAWGQLYARVGSAALDEPLQRLTGITLDELRRADDVGRTAASLEGLDLLVQGVTRLEPEAARERLELMTSTAQPVEVLWIRARIQAWVTRTRDVPPDAWLPDRGGNAASLGELPEPMGRILAHAWPASSGERLHEPRTEAALGLLDDVLELFEAERRWHSASLGTRAVAVFTVLDLLRNERLPGDRLSALLDDHGIVAGGPEPPIGSRAQRRSALARVLARLIDWEEASGDPLLDARTIHQVDDGLLLLGFVPTHRKPPWLTGLADAIEHRFRWRLRRDEDFQPVAFLARFTVREPHPQLYDTLASLSSDRTYPAPGSSESFPLSRVAEDLARQARADLQADAVEDVLDAWDPAPLARWDATARDLARLREAIAALGETTDSPGSGARHLTQLVGRADPRGKARETTLLGLLSKLHTPHRPIPRPGDPPWTPETLEEIVIRASEEAAEAAAMADELEAETDVHVMRALLERLRGSATRLVDGLEDGLPLAETRLLRDRTQTIDEAQATWIAALGAVEEARTEESTDSPEDWDRLLATVTERWTGPARRGVLVRIWRSLARPFRDTEIDPEPHETWPHRVKVVRWGCTAKARGEWRPSEQAAWDEEVARSFELLLQELMEANREDRVLELLQDPAFEQARTASIVQDTIQKARDWCRDRYRLGGSLAARRTLARQRGEQPPSLVDEAGASLAHFSPIWSALLVGAIFLLDFGDAWVELAQAGDVRGIVLTCLIGVLGAYLYVVRDLKSKVASQPGEPSRRLHVRLLGRSAGFTAVCILVAAAITTFLWWMLSETQAVVRGPWAVANIAVWTGFALFVGIVFGLVIQKGL